MIMINAHREIASINKQDNFVGRPNLSELRKNLGNIPIIHEHEIQKT